MVTSGRNSLPSIALATIAIAIVLGIIFPRATRAVAVATLAVCLSYGIGDGILRDQNRTKRNE